MTRVLKCTAWDSILYHRNLAVTSEILRFCVLIKIFLGRGGKTHGQTDRQTNVVSIDSGPPRLYCNTLQSDKQHDRHTETQTVITRSVFAMKTAG